MQGQPMPRNDQVARQWHLLGRLENTRGVTFPELVGSVPEKCSSTGW
jgi:hypothetical protein